MLANFFLSSLPADARGGSSLGGGGFAPPSAAVTFANLFLSSLPTFFPACGGGGFGLSKRPVTLANFFLSSLPGAAPPSGGGGGFGLAPPKSPSSLPWIAPFSSLPTGGDAFGGGSDRDRGFGLPPKRLSSLLTTSMSSSLSFVPRGPAPSPGGGFAGSRSRIFGSRPSLAIFCSTAPRGRCIASILKYFL